MNMDSSAHAYPQLGVSNSEASSFSTCERAWFYGHHPEMHLQPNTMGPALTRGIIGHKSLEELYRAMQGGKDFDSSAQIALEVVQDERVNALMTEDFDKVKMLNSLYKLVEGYCKFYEADIKNWEILGVESFYHMEWEGEDKVYLPMRLDLVIYQKSGKYKGEISPVDHKFTNDFWNTWKMRLNSQFPLYMKALRSAKFRGKSATVVRRTILNMIRTREVKEPQPHDTYKREFLPYNSETMVLAFDNHLKVALRIADLKRMSADDAMEFTTAAWGSPNCQFCSFKSLCAIQLEGGMVANTIRADFKESRYGYPSLEELKDER